MCENYWLPLMDLWSDMQSIRYYIHVLVANSMRCVLTRDIQQKDIVNICIDLTNVFGAQWTPRKRVEGILQLSDHEFMMVTGLAGCGLLFLTMHLLNGLESNRLPFQLALRMN